jgi:hypothetical protein
MSVLIGIGTSLEGPVLIGVYVGLFPAVWCFARA